MCLIDISSAIIRCFEQNEQSRYQLTDGDSFSSMTQIFKAAFLREDKKALWNNKGSTIHAMQYPQSIIHLDAKVLQSIVIICVTKRNIKKKNTYLCNNSLSSSLGKNIVLEHKET